MLPNLKALSKALSDGPGIDVAVPFRVREELALWSERAVRIHDENELEIKEIITGVARAAETIGKRDEKYGLEIGEITARLRAIAELRELAPIRRSIVEGTSALQTCMEKMADDNKSVVSELSAQVEHYRAKLAEAEQSAAVDPLTGLANRRTFEAQLEAHIGGRRLFSLLMIDLNNFKAVNDTYGHVAGDHLLTQFATDLRAQFRETDLVGRWGGDEFVAIVDGGIGEAQLRAGRVLQWAVGEYTLDAGGRQVKSMVSAGIGVVEWDKRESGKQLLERADQKLYSVKTASKVAGRELVSA